MHLKQTYYKKNKYEAGADEAGRGCLAGPVYAAAVILDRKTTILGLDPDSNEGSNRLAIDAQPQTMPDNNQIMNAVNSLRT